MKLVESNVPTQRLRTVRQFFERIIEWDWPDAPPRNPVLAGDIPKKPEPLPKFPDDRDAAKLMAAARASTDPRDRIVVELLARTGMRDGELADLEAGAVARIGAGTTEFGTCTAFGRRSRRTARCRCDGLPGTCSEKSMIAAICVFPGRRGQKRRFHPDPVAALRRR
jgi:site-specific recombinase XerD